MNSAALRLANSASNGITISSRTPSEATSSALRSSVVSSCGVCCGATTDTGCGSNVSTLSAPGDHLAVAEVHAVERADRDAALGAALDVGQASDLHGRTAYLASASSA